ncbi:Holliday junction resolvase RuvX [Fodinicurvata sp. EGI_FJ10296]|uniref:Holliday junction resolvase RuvX n=1 Tax=Fodinicurvata sp. EGI_FJ10296 TaxID=3231908 RepID=UPI0034570804
MPLRKIEDIPPLLPPGGRIMALDLGERTIGMAVSDSGLMLSTSVGTIRRRKFGVDVAALFKEMDERSVAALVVGLPVNLDGTEGPRCDATRSFIHELTLRRDLPVALWDERWSTMAVERAMIAADRTRAKRAKHIDTAAATYILQGALDAMRAAPAGNDTPE